MAEVIRMPKMSDTMTEGVIAAWHKKVGDHVKSGDLLAEVETDKATMELESYQEGVLLHIGVPEKQAVPIDAVIAIIGQKGEDISVLLSSLSDNKVSVQGKSNPQLGQNTQTNIADVSSIKAEIIRMPKMSDTMTEGTIVAWHKKVGDKVKSGDLLAEIATDKATMEFESYSDGTLLYIGVKENESVPVDGILAIIGEAGTDYTPLLQQASATAQKESKVKETSISHTETQTQLSSGNGTITSNESSQRVKISPLARRLAKERGINIHEIKGTGENGRIVKRDIEAYKSASATTSTTPDKQPAVQIPLVVGQEGYNEVPVSQMRKTIARRLAESKFSAPHFYLTIEINMDKAIEARTSINEVSPVKVSFNDMIIKATAAALRKHPAINSSWLGDKIRYNHHIHIGVAMAVEDGLLVPVVKFADSKTLSHIAAEVKEFSNKAKNKQLQPSDWTGNTFTISNLGMFGIEEFTAIINPPDSCILAVGGIKQTAIVKNGQLTVGNVMKVTLSCDHRVVDGATGAAFLQTLKSLLEDPVRILV
ncbi:MAG: pyruvate dehydrogenase complex dihydrolipoamide acetyltransferase [Cytophagaceae bacterium]|nr:pyruvate dehydrogenase complex dihydrolipoamide acetyltransferase [Cytophagaceae bacterium]MDW8455965.1 pyruvate dehydrogenase complex dihydrolipoamide acetyltransferase [Cytophagaceae bacterium]